MTPIYATALRLLADGEVDKHKLAEAARCKVGAACTVLAMLAQTGSAVRVRRGVYTASPTPSPSSATITALRLLDDGLVTPSQLVTQTDLTPPQASALLSSLAAQGKAQRIRRGVYAKADGISAAPQLPTHRIRDLLATHGEVSVKMAMAATGEPRARVYRILNALAHKGEAVCVVRGRVFARVQPGAPVPLRPLKSGAVHAWMTRHRRGVVDDIEADLGVCPLAVQEQLEELERQGRVTRSEPMPGLVLWEAVKAKKEAA